MVNARLTERRPVIRLDLPVPLEPPDPPRVRRIGLLGGSFNPAHAGHRYLSEQALRRLALDEVWWLVAPQNPLKPVADMAPFTARLAQARRVAAHPRIRVLDLEARFGTCYTIDTVRRLVTWPGHRFVWLIGADNLVQLPRWRHWQALLRTVPVAAFERAPYSEHALSGVVAHRFSGARVDDRRLRELCDLTPPAWAFVRLRAHPASSTAIRRGATAAARKQERGP
jgi:nicotinate-nucleotide adenylyltransferase